MLTACGPSQCGKTFWIYKLLLYLEKIPKIKKVVYLYTSYQRLYNEMKIFIKEKKITIDFIDCNKGIPRASDIQTNLLVILVLFLLVKTYVMLMVNYVILVLIVNILFKNIGDRRNMTMVGDNKGIKRCVFNNIVSDIEQSSYGYLLFDNCTTSYENSHVRTNMFPDDKTLIYNL